MPSTAPDVVHVVAAAIRDGAGRYLIARRAGHRHQGGLWEFPGGKLEPGESVQQGLARELGEELGIAPLAARPLIRVRHRYPDKHVLLDVWRVDAFAGEPEPREGQPLAWAHAEALSEYAFPAANYPIVAALRLPDRYLITPEPGRDRAAFLDELARRLAAGIELVQLRAPSLSEADYLELARAAQELTRRHGARLLLNAEPALVRELGADGVHLNGGRLAGLAERPLPEGYWVAASCHDAGDLEQAARIGADMAVLSPVRATASHPDAEPMGWARFSQLVEASALPVYALGGMGVADIEAVQRHGGQGIAAISGLWEAPDG